MRTIAIAVFAAACTLLSVPAVAQNYPAKPIRIIVPYPPGIPVLVPGQLVTPRVADYLAELLRSPKRTVIRPFAIRWLFMDLKRLRLVGRPAHAHLEVGVVALAREGQVLDHQWRSGGTLLRHGLLS